ncbi:MAG: hypothetical protein V3V21_05955 [Thermoplasmata archaeon]
MTEVTEISKGVYEELEEVADVLDTTVAGLVDDILRRWLGKNYGSILDGESDGESGDDGDDDSED